MSNPDKAYEIAENNRINSEEERPEQDFSLWPCSVCKQKNKRSICDPDKQHFPCFKE